MAAFATTFPTFEFSVEISGCGWSAGLVVSRSKTGASPDF